MLLAAYSCDWVLNSASVSCCEVIEARCDPKNGLLHGDKILVFSAGCFAWVFLFKRLIVIGNCCDYASGQHLHNVQ
jgi:hypothetical protein